MEKEKTIWNQSGIALFEVGLPMLFIILIQIIYIIVEGGKVTYVGVQILSLQTALYLTAIFWILPDLFPGKKYLYFSIKFLLAIVSYLLIRFQIIFHHLVASKFFEIFFSEKQLVYGFTNILFVLGTSFFVGLFRERKSLSEKTAHALRMNLKSIQETRRLENTIHQMQLNPHLLFNILNLIKIETANKLPDISYAAGLLAELQRIYLFNPAIDQKVALMQEVKGIEIYFELERYARGRNMYVDFTIVVPKNNLQIPQLLLLTLIENLFKYGALTEEGYPAIINLQLINNTIILHTRNLKRISIIKGNGVGQQNVVAILNHHYSGRYSLIISDTEDYYDLKLEILL